MNPNGFKCKQEQKRASIFTFSLVNKLLFSILLGIHYLIFYDDQGLFALGEVQVRQRDIG